MLAPPPRTLPAPPGDSHSMIKPFTRLAPDSLRHFLFLYITTSRRFISFWKGSRKSSCVKGFMGKAQLSASRRKEKSQHTHFYILSAAFRNARGFEPKPKQHKNESDSNINLHTYNIISTYHSFVIHTTNHCKEEFATWRNKV